MLDIIAAVFGSTGFGALIGGIGGLANRYLDLKVKALELADKKDQRTHELMVLDRELQGKVEISSIEGQAKVESAAYDAMAASYGADKATYGIRFVDGVRGLMRPLITAIFLAIVCYAQYRIWLLVGDTLDLTGAQAFEVIQWTLFEASVVIGWWFASRPPAPVGRR